MESVKEENKELVLPDLDLVCGLNNVELCDKVFDFFNTVPQGMSTFQIQHFVLGDLEFPTPDSKWWQAKLELWVRLQNVIQMHYDYRKKVAKRKELLARVNEYYHKSKHAVHQFEKDKYDAIAERLQVEVEENDFAMMNIKKTIGDKLVEMQAFWATMTALNDKLKFSKVDKEQQEESFWHAKSKIDPRLIERFPETFGDNRYDRNPTKRKQAER